MGWTGYPKDEFDYDVAKFADDYVKKENVKKRVRKGNTFFYLIQTPEGEDWVLEILTKSYNGFFWRKEIQMNPYNFGTPLSILKEFVPSNETYFESDKFATVENLYAEELKLGNFMPYFKKGAAIIEIKYYPLPVYEAETPVSEEPQIEEQPVGESQLEEPQVEELTEEIPSYLPEPDFSMTSFGDNLSDDVPELQEENVIIEQDGVYSIAENLEYTDVVQDADFKSLVDSVL